MVLLLHLMGILVMMPILFAIFFFLNKNPRFLKNAVFFLAGILIAGVGWAVSLGFLAFEAPTGYADLFIKLVLLANLVVVVGIIYLSRLWKNLWLSGLGVVQAVLLGWMSGGQPGWPVGAGGFLLDHLSVGCCCWSRVGQSFWFFRGISWKYNTVLVWSIAVNRCFFAVWPLLWER